MCGVRVPQAVEGEVLHVDGADEGDEALADVVGVLVGADDGGEDVPGLLPSLPYELRSLELTRPVRSEDLCGPFVDVDDSAGAARLRGGNGRLEGECTAGWPSTSRRSSTN